MNSVQSRRMSGTYEKGSTSRDSSSSLQKETKVRKAAGLDAADVRISSSTGVLRCFHSAMALTRSEFE